MRKKTLCGAKTRRGTSCLCKALSNGRCKFHGGLSTGPKTTEGRAQSARNLEKARAALNAPELAEVRSERARRGNATRVKRQRRAEFERKYADILNRHRL